MSKVFTQLALAIVVNRRGGGKGYFWTPTAGDFVKILAAPECPVVRRMIEFL